MAKTVKELLDQARGFHRHLQDFYTKCESSTDSDRMQMLSDYMARHEEALEKALADYESDAEERILNTSLQFSPGDAISSCFEAIQVSPDMQVEDVLRIGLDMDEALVRFYRQVAEDAACEDVRNLFAHLMEHEEREKRLTVRSTMELEQL
ncbi:MAG: hypothetical protein HN341_09095 [Verrucomicrobia bacterium]|jgi:hypothetical protein|nr:hypothetical protein [Verrucomicrobiota bacterium]